ncbi:MAG: Mut7-C RNAse domain-containing protein [Vicinamibacterales bacterium]
MLSVSVRFYGELNDFLPAAHRQATLVCGLESSASIKDLVETLGVPHPEIDLLVVNGRTVDFACRVRDGDRVAAYPPFRAFDLDADARLGPSPHIEPRFVADVHLGRLAAYLRLAGLDTAYRNDYRDHEIVATSASEDRTLLTRDVGVLKHGRVTRGYFVRETRPARQLVEVLRRFDLATRARPFTRCLRCNDPLQVVPKDRVEHLLPPRTREHYREFSRCPVCARIYWQGSHYSQMSLFLERAFAVVAGRKSGGRHDG